MSFQTEISKLSRIRSAFLRFAAVENPSFIWTSHPDRRYGKVSDSLGSVPISGTALRLGTVTRSLASFHDTLEVPSVSVELLDPDGEWRYRARGWEDELLFRNISLWVRVMDDGGLYFDEQMVVAQIRKPTFPSGRVTLDCQVCAGNYLGRQVPHRLITTDDFPNAPPESQGLAVPIIYGRRYSYVEPYVLPPLDEAKDKEKTAEKKASASAATTMLFSPGLPVTFASTTEPEPPATCGDLWSDNFSSGNLSTYDEGSSAYFVATSVSGNIFPKFESTGLGGAELVKVVEFPEGTHSRNFCIEWTSDHRMTGVGQTDDYKVVGLNIVRYDRDLWIESGETSVTEPLAILKDVLTPGTNQTFRIDGGFAIPGFNGYLVIKVNGVEVYKEMNAPWLRSTDTTAGHWNRVAWGPGGTGDDFHIGGKAVPAKPLTVTPAECPAGGTSPSGAAIRAILVGTYQQGDTGDTSVLFTPCNKTPYGTVAALAAALNASKDAGTLVAEWGPCIGTEEAYELQGLKGPVPSDPDMLAALIGEGDMNCLVSGDCKDASQGAGVRDNMYLLAGHALKEVSEVYVLKPVVRTVTDEAGNITEDVTSPVQRKMTEGVDYVHRIIDLNGHRYHVLVFNTAQVSDNCEYYEVTANVLGAETNGDSTGMLIEKADDIFEHLLLNWILNSYQSSEGPYRPPHGPWFYDVAWAPGLWNHDSVTVARRVAELRMEGVQEGYFGGGTLDTQIDARELIHELLTSFDLEFYFDNNIGTAGAWCISRFDHTIPRHAMPHWQAGVDTFLKDSFSLDLAVDRMVNVMPFFGGPTNERVGGSMTQTGGRGDGGWKVSGEYRSERSIGLYGAAVAEPVYFKWTEDRPTIADVMAHYRTYAELPPVTATFRMGLDALVYPLGTLVRVTHPDGLPAGWHAEVCKIVRSDIDLDRLCAQITVLDVDRYASTDA